MSTNKINDNVGKKIVEALKMQSGAVEHEDSQGFEGLLPQSSEHENNFLQETGIIEPDETSSEEAIISNSAQNGAAGADSLSESVDIEFKKSLAKNLGSDDNYDYPSNVAVLCSLMTKLPVGVSRQTAALIITQTMEALGIPMASVIQEAKQTQDDLSARVRECQKSIIECRKQISNLENQSQSYQRQVIKISDIISLFVKSNA